MPAIDDSGETGKQVALGRAEIEALPRATVTTGGPQARVKFEGVSLKLLLEKAGVGFGESLKEAARVLPGCGGRRWLPRRDCPAGTGPSIQ